MTTPFVQANAGPISPFQPWARSWEAARSLVQAEPGSPSQVAKIRFATLEDNRTFKQQMRRRKLRLTDAQRARLAVKEKALGRKVLNEVANIVTPDTIMRLASGD